MLFHQCILSNHLADCFGGTFNSVTPLSDQEKISPHNTNTISRRLMTRIKKNINERIFSRSNLKFSELTSLESYCRQWGKLLMRFCGVKWLSYSISKFMLYSLMALFILGALNKTKTFKLTKYEKLNLLLA